MFFLQTHVQANLYGMGRDSSLFDDPLAYRPERWLRAEGDNPLVKSLSNLTFGHGPRMCLGMYTTTGCCHV